MGFFLRPKDTNLDRTNNHLNAEAIGVVAEYEAEYTDQTGVAEHRRRHPSNASEAKGNAPLPSGSGGRTAVSRTVSSGFGKGTRAGKSSGRRR